VEKDDLYGIISILLSIIAIILSYNKSYLPATIIIGVQQLHSTTYQNIPNK